MLRRTSIASFCKSTPLRLLTVIKMPALSPTMETGNLVSWEMKVGDKIEENSMLAKVQTDKATNDFNYVGDECFLARIIAEAGSTIEVGQAVALAVDEKDELNSDEVKNWKPAAPKQQKKKTETPKPANNNNNNSSASKKTATDNNNSAPAKKSEAPSSNKLPAEITEAIWRSGPAVLRLSASLSADQISSIFNDKKKYAPSGLGNRYTKSDFLRFFPNADFNKPLSSSPFVHQYKEGSAPSSTAPSSSEGKSSDKQPQQASYNITERIVPGVPGKLGIRDDSVLKYLISKKK